MAIQVRCPNPVCPNHTRPRQVSDEMAGIQVGCRACGLVLTIPQAQATASWRLPLAGTAVVLVVAGLVGCLWLAMGDDGGKPDDVQQVVALPDPFTALPDQRTKSMPVEQPVAQAIKPPPIKPPVEPPVAMPPTKDKPAPMPPPPVVEAPPERAPIQLPPPIFDRQPEPPPKPKREARSPANDVKFIIPFDAIGPAAKLDKIKVTQIEGRFSFAGSTAVNPVTMTWQSIARFKWHERAATVDIAFLVDGNKGWFGDGRKVRPMEADGFSFYQNLAYSISLSNLIPLRDKGFEVTKGEEVSVRGRDCFVTRVKSEGRPEMKMYFDKQTGFLAKAEFRGRFFNFNDLKLQKEATLLENYFGNYKKSDGVNHWRRYEQYRNGTKYAELSLDRVQFFEQVDDKWFTFDKSKPPGMDLGTGEWKITRLLPEKKRAGVNSRALQITVMFDASQAPAKAGKGYRLVDADGQVLDRSALRFTSPARRYGILSFDRVLVGREASFNFGGMYLEDEIGQRAALQLGATARK